MKKVPPRSTTEYILHLRRGANQSGIKIINKFLAGKTKEINKSVFFFFPQKLD
jgi:hypothetical protein